MAMQDYGVIQPNGDGYSDLLAGAKKIIESGPQGLDGKVQETSLTVLEKIYKGVSAFLDKKYQGLHNNMAVLPEGELKENAINCLNAERQLEQSILDLYYNIQRQSMQENES